MSAAGIGADQVAEDLILNSFCGIASNPDPVTRVPGDDIARRVSRGHRLSTDRVVTPLINLHTVAAVGQSEGAVHVRADVVALHHILHGPRARNLNAYFHIPGNDVPSLN